MVLTRFGRLLVGLSALLLAGCSGRQPPAGALGAAPEAVTVLASLPSVPETEDAREAFRRACPALLKRTDRSGLTRPEDWAAPCADTGPGLFGRHFRAVRLGDGTGLVTGYYEPEIAAFRDARPGAVPVLGVPPDLVEIALGDFLADLQGRTIRGRWDGGRFRPYFTRAEIEDGALSGHAPVLAHADPIDLFFLQIQGSGRLRFPDGTVERLGYAGQNGHAYVAIGRLIRERGLHPKPGMAEIRDYLAANPEAGRALMRENPSYVFFARRDANTDGPLGSLGVPLLPRANVAADPAVMPLGAPVWLRTEVDGTRFEAVMVASDTGGAIRGANRFDIFFGSGAEAERVAGALSSRGEALILLPKAAAARLAP
jgi:membrane-bound lytic murein transglycosylase A